MAGLSHFRDQIASAYDSVHTAVGDRAAQLEAVGVVRSLAPNNSGSVGRAFKVYDAIQRDRLYRETGMTAAAG